MKSFFLHPRGSALLVTLLLMSVLLILGLGFGKLIIDNIRLEYNVVNAGKAYFAAEAGVEEALFLIDRNLPGFETLVKDDVDGNGENDFQYSLRSLSSSAGGSVPCNYDDPSSVLWHRLRLNESLTLPLFRSGESDKIQNFRVYYYLDPWPTASVQELSVLRWKILGLTPSGETQALSDYVPVRIDYSTAEKPTHFGTQLEGEGQIADGDKAQFRDCSGEVCIFYEEYPLSTFLEGHQSNFLVLSNVPNLPFSDEANDYTLFLRIAEVDNEALVCNRVRIESDGVPRNLNLSGQQYRQNINVDIALDDFLPVFDFALYRTEDAGI